MAGHVWRDTQSERRRYVIRALITYRRRLIEDGVFDNYCPEGQRSISVFQATLGSKYDPLTGGVILMFERKVICYQIKIKRKNNEID